MSNPSEANFWRSIKTGLSNTDTCFTRIENTSALGTPDLLLLDRNKSFHLIELKVAKGNKVLLSPHQIAFCIRHRGANSWVLVKKDDDVLLYRADQAIELFEQGVKLEPHHRFSKPINWPDFLKVLEK